MASTTPSSTRGEFERQRGELIKEIAEVKALVVLSHSLFPLCPLRTCIAFLSNQDIPGTQSFEHVLANINKLNRNLEAVITVGNEFSSVEALWSTFENVMGKDDEGEGTTTEDRANEDEAKSEGAEELEQEEDVKTES